MLIYIISITAYTYLSYRICNTILLKQNIKGIIIYLLNRKIKLLNSLNIIFTNNLSIILNQIKMLAVNYYTVPLIIYIFFLNVVT